MGFTLESDVHIANFFYLAHMAYRPHPQSRTQEHALVLNAIITARLLFLDAVAR